MITRHPRIALLIAALAAGLTLQAAAQDGTTETNKRIITIDGSGGTQSGNLRSGPIVYEHPEPFGITATVSTLSIFGHRVELSAPAGESITRGGERVAAFSDGVRVERGRLTATGPGLEYSEATGLGVLAGRAEVVLAPETEGDDEVRIQADSVAFDVDTDRSTSSGNVALQNGKQSATASELIYEEGRELGVLTSAGAQASITRLDDDGGTTLITADEIRVLTGSKLLYARGNVTVVDGAITSTGNEVFFDDNSGIAEVIGTPEAPARAFDSDSGTTLVTDRIQQDVEYDFFEAIDASVPSAYDAATFDLTERPLAPDGGEGPAGGE